jgi:hypothetical protein
MSEHSEDICLRIQVMNALGQPLGGTADIVCKLGGEKDAVHIRAANASEEIDVRGLRRDCREPYEVTVTPTGSTQGTTQQALVPACGSVTLQFVFSTSQGASHTLSGNLVFDNGLPAAGITTRAYSVGFGGQDTLLGAATTGAGGSYSISYATPASGAANLQVRVLNSAGSEVTLSNTKYNASAEETLNLVVPSSAQPLAPEFQRLATDMEKGIGGVANLAQAQENAGQQDLTLLNQSTNWDARLPALGALAAQQAQTTGIDQQALYAMYRVGLPTDQGTLATVPAATVQHALTTAATAGIASLDDTQVQAAVAAFTTFASQNQLAATTPGGVSDFSAMAAAKLTEQSQQAAFTSLYINNATSTNFWDQAAQLGIAADTLSALKLQGKFLYLTFNNVALASALEAQIGASESLSQLADKDYDLGNTWQTTLQSVVQNTPGATLDSLIPSVYTGAATADRLAAYSGDMARKVRISFPTQVAARMIERNQLAVPAATAAPAAAFLRSAADLGYSLGRTPLNAFLAQSAAQLPALDADTLETVKTLHRIYQVTPSTESYQAALSAGFTSARQIASIDKDDFLAKYGDLFPPNEAQWVWGRSQTVSSVTFNICSSAVLMDTAPPVYSLSAGSAQKQAAKNALIQQFPSIATLFGNLDYCQCQDCSSVLSPAAYFVDVLQFLGPSNPATGSVGSAPNAAGYTPLDVLIGSPDGVLHGRRPDLGALPKRQHRHALHRSGQRDSRVLHCQRASRYQPGLRQRNRHHCGADRGAAEHHPQRLHQQSEAGALPAQPALRSVDLHGARIPRLFQNRALAGARHAPAGRCSRTLHRRQQLPLLSRAEFCRVPRSFAQRLPGADRNGNRSCASDHKLVQVVWLSQRIGRAQWLGNARPAQLGREPGQCARPHLPASHRPARNGIYQPRALSADLSVPAPRHRHERCLQLHRPDGISGPLRRRPNPIRGATERHHRPLQGAESRHQL